MSSDIRIAARRGLSKLATPAGVSLFAAFFCVWFVFHAALGRVLELGYGAYLPPILYVPSYAMTVPGPTILAVALLVVAAAAGTWLFAVLLQTFAGRRVSKIPAEAVADPALTTVRVAVATVLVAALVAVGLALLVVPGLVLAARLQFVPLVVAAEDASLLSAFQKSWRLTAGRWQPLTMVVVGFAVAAVVVAAPAALFTLYTPSVEFLFGVGYAALFVVFGVAVVTELYRSLSKTARRRASGL